MIPIPDLDNRFVEYIAGPSGSGKSTIASEIATEFKKKNPSKPIYIFSRTEAEKDPAFTKLKPYQIEIDESLLDDPVDITQEITEGGCLMIFDDCGTIHNDKLRKEVEKIMADAMEVGRKLNCNIIITNHLVIPNEKKFARTVLNEMNMLTVFPKSGSSQQIKYALKTYYGLNNNQIEKILKLPSRWVRISKTCPQYVLYQGGAFIL
jgi:ABC-type polar amino acid transport system ATPase subunit